MYVYIYIYIYVCMSYIVHRTSIHIRTVCITRHLIYSVWGIARHRIWGVILASVHGVRQCVQRVKWTTSTYIYI